MKEQQFTAFWRWTDKDGVVKTAPFVFEAPEGEFRRCFEQYLAPRWRRDFPSNYASWAAEASRNAPKPIPYLNLPEPPLPELNVLYFPSVASQYAHIAAIFNAEIPVGQRIDLVSNIPLWRRSTLFFGVEEPEEPEQPETTTEPQPEEPKEYITTLYVVTRRDATDYPVKEKEEQEDPHEPEDPNEPEDPTEPEGPTDPEEDKKAKAFLCVLVDWRYFARSVLYSAPLEQGESVRFFDRVVAILESFGYLSDADAERVKTIGICSDQVKRTPSVPLDPEVFADGASLPLLLDAALYCRGAYLYNGEGIIPEQPESEDEKEKPRSPAQIGFPTIDLTETVKKKPKFIYPDYWTEDEPATPGGSASSTEPVPNPEHAINYNFSLSLTGYVNVPAVLAAPPEPENPETPEDPEAPEGTENTEGAESEEDPETPETEEEYVVQNLETIKRIARYVGSAIDGLSLLSTSATFWLGDRCGDETFRYIPDGGFANEQNSLAGLNTSIWFPIYGPDSKPWDSEHGQITASRVKQGPFRYKYRSRPSKYLKKDFRSGWVFAGPIMDAENTIEASNSVIGMQGNGVSLGFNPVASPQDASGATFDLYGVAETRIVRDEESGLYQVYYAADAPSPVGNGAVVSWKFADSKFLFSAINVASGWNGAGIGTVAEAFTQNETRDALVKVSVNGGDSFLKELVESAGESYIGAQYMCYSPFSKAGDTLAADVIVCVSRNALLKRFEIIQAECD